MLKILLILFVFGPLSSFATSALPTFFSYEGSDLHVLEKIESPETLDQQELESWDAYCEKVIDRIGLSYDFKTLFFTYLYAAQRDVAFLSYEIKECFEGSFDPISAKIFKLFFPNEPLPKKLKDDLYSEQLAYIVAKKYARHLEKERNLPTIQWKLWSITFEQIHIQPPPPLNDPIWKKELEAVLNMQKKMTEKEEQIILKWSHRGRSTTGDWRAIANSYLFEHYEPVAKLCLVRSLVTMGIIDSLVVSQKAKKLFDIKRPFQQSKNVKLFASRPTHASYPSTHATIAGAVAEILCYFLRDECEHWQELEKEGDLSRIYGGVHYPIDIEEGKKIGHQIGDQLLSPLHDA